MPTRTHPADVTADRLVKHYEADFDRLTATERDAISTAIEALRRIAENARTAPTR